MFFQPVARSRPLSKTYYYQFLQLPPLHRRHPRCASRMVTSYDKVLLGRKEASPTSFHDRKSTDS
jgi:hypothetical protein